MNRISSQQFNTSFSCSLKASCNLSTRARFLQVPESNAASASLIINASRLWLSLRDRHPQHTVNT
jgi:hypothetical protein